MCNDRDLSITNLDSLSLKIRNLEDLSDIKYVSPDFINGEDADCELDLIPLGSVVVYNVYSGVICNLLDTEKLYKYDKKYVRDSYLFIEYTGSVVAPYNTGCIRYSLKNKELVSICTLSDGFGVDIRSDILSICTSPLKTLYKFILPKNHVKLDETLLCATEGYGKNINLYLFFSRYQDDTTNKYTMIEFRESEDDDWHILSLKTKRDFENFINDVTDNPILQALYKRLKLVCKNTDFSYLGYN